MFNLMKTAVLMAAITALFMAVGAMVGGRNVEGRSNPVVGMLVAILAPIAASVIQMSISRAREFEVDRGGAEISGDPQALASALTKIQQFARQITMEPAERRPETAQMMIMNPLTGGGIKNLLRTHRPTEERVARLLEMAPVR